MVTGSRAHAPVGVGLLGCGRIARMFHLPVLRDLPSARLVAVADVDTAALAQARAVAPDAVGVPGLDALLAVPGIRAIVVCLPTHLHAAAATAAFDAGRDVYVEKPLALDLEEAGRVRAAWLASGRAGAVGFNLRFHPLHRSAGAVLTAGGIGEIVGVRTVFSSAPRDLPEWKRDRATGGGALLDLASHHVDLLRHLLGAEVDAVSATIRSRRSPHDTATLSVQLSTGVVAQLLATGSAAASDRMEILGTEATMEIDRMTRRRITLVPAAAPGRSVGDRAAAAARVLREAGLATWDRLRPPPEPSFAAALAAFVDHSAAVDAGVGAAPVRASIAATVEDGYRGLAVVEAAERSAASGREARLVRPGAGT